MMYAPKISNYLKRSTTERIVQPCKILTRLFMISLLVYRGAANQAEVTKRWTELLYDNSVCCVADVKFTDIRRRILTQLPHKRACLKLCLKISPESIDSL